jgi:outer membrane protein assembly factor BamB
VLSLDDGHEVWSAEAAPGAKSVDSPVLAGGALYVVADGAVVRLAGALAEKGE